MPTAGPIGRTLIKALEELLRASGLSQRRLAAELESIGRPIPALGIARILKGERRVDVDELVALAVLFGVNVSSLVLPVHAAADDVVELTPAVRQRVNVTWNWADGHWPLPAELLPEGTTAVTTPGDRAAFFNKYGRPDYEAPNPDPAIQELDELERMIERVLAESEGVKAWADWRDVILRRCRLVAIQLEELFDRLDRDARRATGIEYDTAAAIAEIRDAWERVREPITQYVPGTTERYKDNARADRERAPGLRGSPTLRDPFSDNT
jgi:transcriptional regulator with XRE-family HTH domain